MRKNVMKKWAVIGLSCIFAVALAGCGANVKATDPEVTDTDTATVEEKNSIEGTDSEKDEENENTFAGMETDSMVLYSEIEEYGKYMPLTEQPFEADENTFIAYEDIPIYNVNGVEVGYIKNGSTVTTTESGTEIYWARFENPIKEAGYDYLYLTRDYIKEAENIETRLSAEDMKDLIIKQMNARDENELPTILDAPDSDMEVYECRISRESDSSIVDYNIRQALYTDTFSIGDYMTFSLECVEDDDYIACTIYYKDSYEEWAEQNK